VYNINEIEQTRSQERTEEVNVLGFVIIVIGLALLFENLDKKIKGPKRFFLMFVIGLLLVVGADLSS